MKTVFSIGRINYRPPLKPNYQLRTEWSQDLRYEQVTHGPSTIWTNTIKEINKTSQINGKAGIIPISRVDSIKILDRTSSFNKAMLRVDQALLIMANSITVATTHHLEAPTTNHKRRTIHPLVMPRAIHRLMESIKASNPQEAYQPLIILSKGCRIKRAHQLEGVN